MSPGEAILLVPGATLPLPIDTMMRRKGMPLGFGGGGGGPPPIPAENVATRSSAPDIVVATTERAELTLTAVAPGKASIRVAGDYKGTRTAITLDVEVKVPDGVTLAVALANPEPETRELRNGDRITLARGVCYPVKARAVLDGQHPNARTPTLLTVDGGVGPGTCETLSLYSGDARTVEVGKIGGAAAITVEFVEPTFALTPYGHGYAHLIARTPTGEPLALPEMLYRETNSATPAACTRDQAPPPGRFSSASNGWYPQTPAGGTCLTTCEIAKPANDSVPAFTVTLPWPAVMPATPTPDVTPAATSKPSKAKPPKPKPTKTTP